jgi:uncharacterized membrane protein (DUF373 family)
MFVLTASIIDLIRLMFQYLFVQTSGLHEPHDIISLPGVFLLALIGVELLATIRAYFKENSIHGDIANLLAIIAISSKVTLLDFIGMTGFDFALGLTDMK